MGEAQRASFFQHKESNVKVLAAIAGLGAFATVVASWITHVIVCIKTTSWVLLAFGCIVAPVGVIHGIGVWFGAF